MKNLCKSTFCLFESLFSGSAENKRERKCFGSVFVFLAMIFSLINCYNHQSTTLPKLKVY